MDFEYIVNYCANYKYIKTYKLLKYNGGVYMTFITDLLNQFGYIVLYILLTLELMALPFPGELLMTYCGFLVFKGNLNYIVSIIFSTAGVITGITISYFIGKKLGRNTFCRYAYKLHIGSDKLEMISRWFERYGYGLLIIVCFIPGIRHITGYFSGITKMPYKKFAINSYLGAVIWSTTFISLGKVFGYNYDKFNNNITKCVVIGIIGVLLILLIVYLIKRYKN
jgi:membrane protein DedA with SNARE-associated domain